MKAKIALVLAVTLIAFEAIMIVNSKGCTKVPVVNLDCGEDCTGRPHCGGDKRCGNIDDVCYCDCNSLPKCKPTDLGWAWNDGATYPNGTYRFDGVKGDGKEYDC